MLDFPATHRNREVIGDVLAEIYPAEEKLSILELASGSGQHAVYLAQRFKNWTIQPSDVESDHLDSIRAYTEHHQMTNVSEPLFLDVGAKNWNLSSSFDGIWAINLIHIAPWACTLQLFANAGRYLNPQGTLYLYGAYRRDGEHTSESNRAFDRGLRETNRDWGVRCLNEVTEVAKAHALTLHQLVEMPANNLSLVFRKANPEPRRR